jgi:hypothetical protein
MNLFAAPKALTAVEEVFDNPPFDAGLSEVKVKYDLGALRSHFQILAATHWTA